MSLSRKALVLAVAVVVPGLIADAMARTTGPKFPGVSVLDGKPRPTSMSEAIARTTAAHNAGTTAPVVPTLGTRYTVNMPNGPKMRTGIYENVTSDKGYRFQQVSADGTRLLKGKTFTLDAGGYAAAVTNGYVKAHTLALAA